jgi:hypothetical protein
LGAGKIGGSVLVDENADLTILVNHTILKDVRSSDSNVQGLSRMFVSAFVHETFVGQSQWLFKSLFEVSVCRLVWVSGVCIVCLQVLVSGLGISAGPPRSLQSATPLRSVLIPCSVELPQNHVWDILT